MNWFYSLFQIYLLGGSGGKNSKKLTKFENNRAFIVTFIRLVQDALKRYKITGLIDTMSERVILQSLLWYGSVVFMEKQGNIISLAGVPSGKGYNVNGDPASAWVYSKNGIYNEEIDLYIPGSDESAFLKKTNTYQKVGKAAGVMVFENETRTPFIETVIYYAQIIADTMRTLDVCRKHLKNPYIIACEESLVPTVKKYFQDRDDNMEFIISSGVFPADKVSVLPLQTTPEALKSATELIEWYENKFREACGTDSNPQIDKKGENLIQAEVDQNDMYTELRGSVFMDTLQRGLDDVNKLYGLNLKVEPVIKKETFETEDKEGEDEQEI